MDKLIQDLSVLAESAAGNFTAGFSRLPGSAIVIRYVRSSHQNDPARTVLELLLLLFAIRYFLASKYSFNKQNYVRLTEDEVDELVADWEPEPLVKPISAEDEFELASIPVLKDHNGPTVSLEGHGDREFINLTSTDVYNFNNNVEITQKAVDAIRKYGVGSCGPAGFYGHQDAHATCEGTISKFLGVDDSILYSQGFATASSVIPCFLKRGDVIIADPLVNIGIQKGMQLSRASVLWYEHGNWEDLERVMALANKSHRRGPLPRRVLITEGIYENEGDSPNLVKMVELKKKYKYRLMLDESWSLGVLGETGRGLPEEQGVPRSEIDFTVSTLANAFGSSGGFCAGETTMVDHQRITSLAYTFSATMPAYLANTTTNVTELFDDAEFRKSHFEPLWAKAKTFADIAAKSRYIEVSRVDRSPMMLLRIPDQIIAKKLKKLGLPEQQPDTPYTGEAATAIQHLLQSVVDEALAKGVLITRHKMLAEHEQFPIEHAIKITMSNGLSADQVSAAAAVVSEAFRMKLQ